MATSVPASSSAGTLDVPSLVSQLMSVERQPINNLNTQVTTTQSKISSLGTMKGLVSSFQSALQSLTSSLQGYTATSSDTSIFSASAASTAVAGTYSLAVTKLAQSQNLVTTGQASSTAAIGNGTATTINFLSTAGGTKNITIDSSNNTLQGISAAINAANIGITATIVNDGSATSPYRLSLTASSGASNSLTITTSGGDGSINSLLAYDPAGTKYLTQTSSAQDANFTVNGIAISSASNTVNNAINGVTLTLNNLTAAPVSLTVAHDPNAVSKAASGFVDAYNAIQTQITSRSAYGNATTAAGALAGDGTLRLMQDQLRSIFMTPASGGTMTSLSQVGITTNAADGTLKLDSSVLNSAMANNYSDVTNLFSGATGYTTRLNAWSTSVLTPGGLIDTHVQSLNTKITNFNNQISQLENRMTVLQAQYTSQYTNLNMILSSMNATSAYLTQQFSNVTK